MFLNFDKPIFSYDGFSRVTIVFSENLDVRSTSLNIPENIQNI